MGKGGLEPPRPEGLDHPAAGQDSGAAYLYERDLGGPDAWGERKELLPSDGQPFKGFGISVAIWGELAIVGAGCDDELGSCAGAAYAYDRDQGGPGAWGQSQKLLASDGKQGDFFGNSAAMHGSTAFVGAPFWTPPRARPFHTPAADSCVETPGSAGASARLAAHR